MFLIVIMAPLGLPVIKPLAKELALIMRTNSLLPSSYMSLSYTGMVKDTLVTPAGNVTMYSPEK